MRGSKKLAMGSIKLSYSEFCSELFPPVDHVAGQMCSYQCIRGIGLHKYGTATLDLVVILGVSTRNAYCKIESYLLLS